MLNRGAVYAAGREKFRENKSKREVKPKKSK